MTVHHLDVLRAQLVSTGRRELRISLPGSFCSGRTGGSGLWGWRVASAEASAVHGLGRDCCTKLFYEQATGACHTGRYRGVSEPEPLAGLGAPNVSRASRYRGIV